MSDLDVTAQVTVDDGDALKKISQLEKALADLQGQVNKSGAGSQALGQLTAGFTKLAGAVTLAVSAAVSLKELADGIKNSIDRADEFNKAAQKVGVSVEALSQLDFAASLSDVNTDALTTGLTKLNKQLSEAQNPSSQAAIAFKALGVSVKDANGNARSTEDVFKDLADVFAKSADGPNKTAAALQIFGKAGADLIPLLNSGSEGLAKMAKESDNLGTTISGPTAQASEQFNDTLTRISKAGEGMYNTLASELLPTLQALADEFLASVQEGGLLYATGEALGVVFTALSNVVFKPLLIVLKSITTAFQLLGKFIGATAAAATLLATGDLDGAGQVFAEFGKDVVDSGTELAVFTGKLYGVIPATAAATNATDDNTKSQMANIAALKEKQKLAEQEQKTYEKAIDNLLKQREGYLNLSDVQKLQMELERGSLAKLTDAHKQHLLVLAQENQMIKAQGIVREAAFGLAESVLKTQQALNVQQQTQNNVLQDYLANGEMSAEVTTQVEGALNGLNEQLLALNVQAAKLKDQGDIAGFNYLSEQAGELSAAIDEQRAKYMALYTTIQQNKLYEDTVRQAKSAQDTLDKLANEQDILSTALERGEITVKEYNAALQNLDKQRFDALKSQFGDLEKLANGAAVQLESSFSDLFFDVMQGQMTDLVGNFKRAIDRMVADLLAADLGRYLFGVNGASTYSGGNSGAFGQFAGFLGGLFGGARAAGGPVDSGKGYLVGEKGPEWFAPSVDGTVIDAQQTSEMNSGGSVVNMYITAMDSKDVMQTLSGSKRQIADMVSATMKTYNYR